MVGLAGQRVTELHPQKRTRFYELPQIHARLHAQAIEHVLLIWFALRQLQNMVARAPRKSAGDQRYGGYVVMRTPLITIHLAAVGVLLGFSSGYCQSPECGEIIHDLESLNSKQVSNVHNAIDAEDLGNSLILSNCQDKALGFHLLGKYYLQSGKKDDSLKYYEMSVNSDSTYAPSVAVLAALYYMDDRIRESSVLYKKLFEIEPERTGGDRVMYMQALEQLGDGEGARKQREIIENSWSDACREVTALLEAGDEVRAVEMAEASLAHARDDMDVVCFVDAICNVGMRECEMLLRDNKYEDAIVAYSRLLDIVTPLPEVIANPWKQTLEKRIHLTRQRQEAGAKQQQSKDLWRSRSKKP